MAYTNPDTIEDFDTTEVSSPEWGQAMGDGLDTIWAGLSRSWEYWNLDCNILGSGTEAAKIQCYKQQIGYEALAFASFEVVDAAEITTVVDLAFDLPYTNVGRTPLVLGTAAAYDSSAGVWHHMIPMIKDGDGGNGGGRLICLDNSSNDGFVSDSHPFSWALGDMLAMQLHYPLDALPATGELVG